MYYFVTIAREACRNELVDAGSGSADRPQAAHLHRLLTGFPPICGMQPNHDVLFRGSQTHDFKLDFPYDRLRSHGELSLLGTRCRPAAAVALSGGRW